MTSSLPLATRFLTAGLFVLATYFQARALSLRAAHAACPTWATIPSLPEVSNEAPASEAPLPSTSAVATAEPRDPPRPPRELPRVETKRATAQTPPLAVAQRQRPSPTAGLRFVPERVGSSIRGFRLFGVRSGSIAETVGLRNGDRIEAIDGNNLSNPAEAIRAYTRIRSADSVNVVLTRAGRRVTLTYNFK